MTAKKTYVFLSAFCLIVAMIDMSWRRFAWALFSFAFILAADKIKDVEKAKRKERIETENRMTAQMLNDYEKALDGRYETIRSEIAATSNTLLKQLAEHKWAHSVRGLGCGDTRCDCCDKDAA